MALGAKYPAVLIDANDQSRNGEFLQFTDADNQPASNQEPFVSPVDEDSTVLEDSDGNPLILGGDETSGVQLKSPDGNTSLAVRDTGVSFAGSVGFFASDPVAAPADTIGALITLGLATAAITSGTLPNTGAWVSGTAKVNPAARDITVNVECVFDGTANAATVAILVSPDNTTFTTIGTPGVSAAINTVGGLTQLVPVRLPKGWFIKLTIAAHASVAASIYY